MKTNSIRLFNETKIKTVCNTCELIIAAWELKNPSNIGHIIRLSHNINARKTLFVGNYENYRESKIRKTAGFSFDQQDWQFITQNQFYATLENEFEILILETCEGSVSIFEAELPEKVLILAGNETHGLPENIIRNAARRVYIPMPGSCKSMNVSHAVSVAAFEWFRRHSR